MNDNQFSVTCWYNACSTSTVTLPDGIGWADIESWYIKWNCFHYVLKGETEWSETDLGDINFEDMDTKRPTEVEICRVDEDGRPTGETMNEEGADHD